MSRVNAMVPPARRDNRATSAHPPLYGVPSGKEWRERHNRPQPSIWARLNPFAKSASPVSPPEDCPPLFGVVEADVSKGEG